MLVRSICTGRAAAGRCLLSRSAMLGARASMGEAVVVWEADGAFLLCTAWPIGSEEGPSAEPMGEADALVALRGREAAEAVVEDRGAFRGALPRHGHAVVARARQGLFAARLAEVRLAAGSKPPASAAAMARAYVCQGCAVRDVGEVLAGFGRVASSRTAWTVLPSSSSSSSSSSSTTTTTTPAAARHPSSGQPLPPHARASPAARALRQMLYLPLVRPDSFRALGVECPRGVLLHGPPGVGKTWTVRAVAASLGVEVHEVDGPALLAAGLAGEGEAALRAAFARARAAGGPCALFIDEIDVLCPRRVEGRSSTVVAQLLTLMDGLDGGGGHVVVVGATNRPNAVDPALRRPGRFDREVEVPPPDEAGRAALLRHFLRLAPLEAGDGGDDALVARAAAESVGFVGADLEALCREAVRSAARRRAAAVGWADLDAARRLVGASSRRGHAVRAAATRWEDVAGLEDAKRALRQAVEWPLERGDAMRRLGLRPTRGVLLYGPPGCSKTTLVRCMASGSRSAFLALSGAQVHSAYAGEAERTVRDAFARARANAPCVLFFDELDAVVGSRDTGPGGGGGGAGAAETRLLAAFLTEMDGVEGAGGVLVVAATNRPDALDAALLRPGRFDRLVCVPPPDEEARLGILRLKTRGVPLACGGQSLPALARGLERYSGADLEAVCREAALRALRAGRPEVAEADLRAASAAVRPSITSEMLARMDDLRRQF